MSNSEKKQHLIATFVENGINMDVKSQCCVKRNFSDSIQWHNSCTFARLFENGYKV